jgi:GEVED domain/Secretion system C-terminal sorting domain/SprB repeat
MRTQPFGRIFTIALLFLCTIQKNFACGVDYVSQGATTLEMSVNGQQFFGYVGTNTWMTNLQNHNFGTVTSLNLTKVTNITWESCTNYVLDATLFYRIFPTNGTPGAFIAHPINDLNNGGVGSYRTRTLTDAPNLDLLNGINGGSYYIELYFRSNVDYDNNGSTDGFIQKNNGGAFFRAQFTKSGGAGGGLTVSFSNKTNISCFGNLNGKVTASATGGNSYSYLWSNGATTATIMNVAAGTFSVTVTSGALNGTGSTVISQPSQLLANVVSTDRTSAGVNNGTATANPSGGTSPFTFLWNNGATTAAISSLNVGNFTVTVTDSKSCTALQTVTIGTSSAVPGGYCASSAAAPWQDWINNVTLDGLNNTSSKATYSNFTNLAPANLSAGESYPISISATGGWWPYNEHWGVWIDFDRSGTFESTEKVVNYQIPASASGLTTIACNQIISIPANAQEGVTRMRVAIKRDGAPLPCEAIVNGEVEDYHVRINPSAGTCTMTTTVSGILCNDNGTNANAADDRFSFNLNVTETGIPGTGWSAVSNGTNFTGNYGTVKNMSFFPISNGPLSFSVKDNGDPNGCKKTVFVTPPATCSNNVPCAISAAVTAVNCENNGTTNTGTDDKFTFTLMVNGTGTGAGWTANVNGVAASGTYNVAKNFGPYPISGGNLTFNVIDANNAGCTSPIIVSPPSPCSVTGGPTSYCLSNSQFPWEEWISKVQVAGINNATGKWTYTDFTSQIGAMVVNQSYPISLAATVSYSFNPLYFKVFIDWNKDGIFTEASETAFSGNIPSGPLSATNILLNGNISVPSTATAGVTRMRVSMKRGSYAGACEAGIPYGEVEDYSLEIATSATGGAGDRSLTMLEAKPLGHDKVQLTTAVQSGQMIMDISIDRSIDGQYFEPIKVWNDLYLTENQLFTHSEIDENPILGHNFYRQTTTLRNGQTIFSNIKIVDLSPLSAFTIYPNPTSGQFFIDLTEFDQKEVSVKIFNILGKLIFSKIMVAEGGNPIEIDGIDFQNGEYFIQILEAAHKPIVKKLRIQHD